jgi:hypothetical protein
MAWAAEIPTEAVEGDRVGNVNRKASRDEMAHAYRVIREAFPDLEAVFGGHSAYGGHRAPRDHTVSLRLRDSRGQLRSNVVWVLPQYLASLTPDDVRDLVSRANGERRKRRR